MPKETATTILGHIAELTKRMKAVIYVFAIASIVMLVLPGNLDAFWTTGDYQPLISLFLKYIRDIALPAEVKLIALQMSDPIELYMMASLVFAACITIPVLAYEVYKFVHPGLEANERKAIFPFVSVVSVLFVAGGVFGFFILFPMFVNAMFPFYTAVGAELMFSLMDFYDMLFFTLIVSGVLFTIPAFFSLLVKFGVLHTSMFAKKRKYIYLALIALAMFLSPGAAPQANLFLFIALALLFEISMLVGRRFEGESIKTKPLAMRFFSNPFCKFCKIETDGNSRFCPRCHRSIE